MIKVYQATEFGNNEKPYVKVAEFNHDSIQQAYSDTNSIDECWCERLGMNEAYRSTSSGDVLVENGVVHFLVPMGNGRDGDKMYSNWGETEVINNFNVNGFTYDGDHKVIPNVDFSSIPRI